MKNRRLVLFFITAAVLTTAFMVSASAVPVDTEVVEILEVKDTFSFSKILPAIFGATLIVESLLIILISDVKRIVTVSFASLIANVISFFTIRVLLGTLKHELFYSGMLIHGLEFNPLLLTVLYLAAALAIELPILWLSLRNFTEKKGRLMLAAGVANLVTTIAVTVVELQLDKLHP